MASLPPQQQRRSQARQTSNEGFQQVQRQDSEAPSTTSVDSQTVLLGHTGHSSSTRHTEEPQEASSAEQQVSAPEPNTAEDSRRCWICLIDEVDEEEPRVWRNPCPCVLTAHESCLLDWVADAERPSGDRTTSGPVDIRCPQCKSPILLSRPQSYILNYARGLENFASMIVWPATVYGLGYSVLLAFSHHGVHSIRRIFGDQDSLAILSPRSPSEWNWLERAAAERFPDLALPFLREWRGIRVEMGLPLVPAALVLSRTDYGDPVLPLLPIIFFATHRYSYGGELHGNIWPPSAALTMCVLPYVRQIYNDQMERIWGKRERAWMEEVRPHFGDDTPPADGAPNGEVADVIDIRIDVNINDGGNADDNDSDEEVEEEEEERAPGLNDPPLDDNLPDGVENVGDIAAELGDMGDQPPEDLANAVERAVDQAQAQQRQRRRQQLRAGNWENFLLLNKLVSGLGTSVGALFFPMIASASGDVLKVLLPKALTTAPPYARSAGIPPGLLQTKWGRSVLGGCLFVLLKDAIRIYCRWRMAVSFRNRKVIDYDKSTGLYRED